MLRDILEWAGGLVAAIGASPAVRYVLGKAGEIMEVARTRYNVNPVVFLVLYVVPGPFWYYTVFRTIREIARKNTSKAMLWGTICLVVTVQPYLYVLIFGRNMPWWIYIVIGVLVAQGVFTLVRRLVKKPAAQEPPAQGAPAQDPPAQDKPPQDPPAGG